MDCGERRNRTARPIGGHRHRDPRLDRDSECNSLILVPKGVFYRKSIDMVDLRTGRSMQSAAQAGGARNHFPVLSADGRYAAATGDSVYVWELSTGERLNDAYQPDRQVIEEWLKPGRGGYGPRACAFSQDGELLAVGTGGQKLLVFEVETGKLLKLVDAHCRLRWWVTYVAFLGPTRYVLAMGEGLGVYDCRREEWVEIPAFSGDPDMDCIGAVAVAGQSIFVCDYSGNLRRFDWEVVEADGSK